MYVIFENNKYPVNRYVDVNGKSSVEYESKLDAVKTLKLIHELLIEDMINIEEVKYTGDTLYYRVCNMHGPWYPPSKIHYQIKDQSVK